MLSQKLGKFTVHYKHCYTNSFVFVILNTLFRHVHGFLEEIGQGVQHVASRVDDIISFVQEANDRRKIFGEVSRLGDADSCGNLTLFGHLLKSQQLSLTHYPLMIRALHS